MESLLIYFATGIVGGFLAGLFGIGGGVVIVPLLVLAFNLQHVAPRLVVHLAIGTSLACISLTALSSAWTHYQQGGVRRDWFMRLLPGLVGGAVLGVIVGDQLSADVMHDLLGIFFLLVAVQMWINRKPTGDSGMPGTIGMSLAGAGIGGVSALFGVGGGALTVPFLSWRGAAITDAVGTSAAAGLPIALIGAVTSIFVGAGADGLPTWATGYVVWPAFASIVILGVPMARIGARVAHRLPGLWLKRCFAILLTVVAVKFLL